MLIKGDKVIYFDLGNNTEDGIWHHVPDLGTDLIIAHPIPTVPFACIVHQPALRYYLHISTPVNFFYPNQLRYFYTQANNKKVNSKIISYLNPL